MAGMKFKLPAGVFPEELQLTPAQEASIVQYCDELVAETLHVSEDFITNGRRLDPERWKFVRSKERMHVYRSRKANKSLPDRPHLMDLAEVGGRDLTGGGNMDSHKSGNSSSSSGTGNTDYLTEDSLLDDVRPAHIPVVVITGILDGTIEDCAFGALSDNMARWRLRNSYLGDEYDDMKILARIHTPTEEDPCRFLGIKWTTRTFGPFVRQRDFLYIESTGLALDSNGDRVAYTLMHSYPLDQVRELSDMGIIRGKASTCFIARQHSKTSVEIFCRAFSDPGGEIFESIGVTLFSEALLAQGNVIECAYVKKLTWLMTRASEERARNHQTHARLPAATHCASCEKSLKSLSNVLLHSGGGTACQVCRQSFCGKCSVSKKVSVDIGKGVTQKALSFCVSCVMEAKKLQSWDVAMATLPSAPSVVVSILGSTSVSSSDSAHSAS